MFQPTINVPLTARQLEFMILLVHEDNKFRHYLEDQLEQLRESKDDK